jgi:hypothetical protein
VKFNLNQIFFLLIFLCGCQKDQDGCPPLKEEFFELYPRDLPILKCDEFDTIEFKSNKGEKIVFYGTGQIDSGYTSYWANTSGDCRYWRKIEKYYTIIYNSPTYKTDFRAGVFYYYGILHFGYKINDIEYHVSYDNLPKYPNTNYLNSAFINGKQYYKVIKIYKDAYATKNPYLYYGMGEGLIQIILPNSDTLTVVN